MEFGPVIKNSVLDINMLVRQGTMLNQSVQTVEGDSTADQATTDLLAKKDPVIHEISVGISGEEASLYTVSGTPPLSLPNSLGKPLTAWEVEVSPYQEGTGDPSPDNVRPIHGTDKLNLFVEESYDPTATPKAVLTLPSTVYTATIGSGGGESRWGEVDLGTLTWTYNTSDYPIPLFVSVISGKKTGYTNLLCEQLAVETGSSWATLSNCAMKGSGGSSSIAVRLNEYTDVASFRAAMSGVKLLYELNTPTEFAISAPSIPTPKGTATTWATAEDGTVESMSVTYVG